VVNVIVDGAFFCLSIIVIKIVIILIIEEYESPLEIYGLIIERVNPQWF